MRLTVITMIKLLVDLVSDLCWWVYVVVGLAGLLIVLFLFIY